jgi:hypothetical protein
MCRLGGCRALRREGIRGASGSGWFWGAFARVRCEYRCARARSMCAACAVVCVARRTCACKLQRRPHRFASSRSMSPACTWVGAEECVGGHPCRHPPTCTRALHQPLDVRGVARRRAQATHTAWTSRSTRVITLAAVQGRARPGAAEPLEMALGRVSSSVLESYRGPWLRPGRPLDELSNACLGHDLERVCAEIGRRHCGVEGRGWTRASQRA